MQCAEVMTVARPGRLLAMGLIVIRRGMVAVSHALSLAQRLSVVAVVAATAFRIVTRSVRARIPCHLLVSMRRKFQATYRL